MNIIGIDFSLRFPGICIYTKHNNIHFIGIVNTRVTKSDKKQHEEATSYHDISIINTFHNKLYTEDTSYYIKERNKINNYIQLVDLIITCINDYLDNAIVSIEGLSYNAKGNAIFDLAEGAGHLKNKIVEKIGLDRLFIFSPGELKTQINAKGNASKLDVFNQFINDPLLEQTKKSNFYQLALNGEFYKNSDRNKIISPFEDMVDAYLAVLKINNNINHLKQEQ